MKNPLLESWDTQFKIAPFKRIADADFTPALEQALKQAEDEISAIAETAGPADFTNTIAALDLSGQALHRVLSVFFTLAGADSNPERQALQRAFSPKLAAHTSSIYGNKALFQRIEAVWQQRADLGLSAEEQRLLLLTRRAFLRAGAALEGADAARIREIMARLAALGTAFTQNLLADEATWQMDLSAAVLEKLPEFLRRATRAAGQERGADGPVITLSRTLIVPFLQYAPQRDLRAVAFHAWAKRGANGGDTDNRAIAAEILALRAERAALLGYDSFADYKLETEMAKAPQAVRDLLSEVWVPARAQAEADAEILTKMMHAEGHNGRLEPWDWRYYAQKRRAVEHNLDEAALKPYLQLDRMIDAAFACAQRLFGLDFAPVDIALYHPDCRAWEVTREGRHVAVLIGDYFARASKRSGAWCSAMRGQARRPEPQGPVVINVCNFAKGDPTLLSYDEAQTLFHEFGHALHQMLSDVTFESLSGTNVARDFVELPSQLFEHWLDVPEVLEAFATHVETHAPMPREMLERVLGAANFDMGFQSVEYIASALVDLGFHEGAPPVDPMAKQAEILEGIGMPHAIAMRHATPQFAHVFAGDGYASGYYSYMWSEVMEADAFAAFTEAGGPFDGTQAKALEDTILSKGGTESAEALYLAFRGRLPGVEALLKGRGLTAG